MKQLVEAMKKVFGVRGCSNPRCDYTADHRGVHHCPCQCHKEPSKDCNWQSPGR